MLRYRFGFFFATTLATSFLFAQRFPLTDATGLAAPNVKMEAVNYLGRQCVRMTVEGEDRGGLVLLPGTDFQDGVIEADIALKITTPPGVRYPGFVGIAFRARPDASHSELFYVRPGNSDAADQAMRNHAVQYVSEPDFGWYRLRREWPSVYESNSELTMETWTKVRIEVAGRSAKLYLNGATRPSLVVDGLKGEDLHGAVGLWGYTNEEAHFANVRITPAAPQNVKNGSDVSGSWDMRYASDAGGMPASMELHREGSHVSGTWSGPLGGAGRSPARGETATSNWHLSVSGRRRAGRERRARSTPSSPAGSMATRAKDACALKGGPTVRGPRSASRNLSVAF